MMTQEKIAELVKATLQTYCLQAGIDVEVTEQTPLIGSSKLLDSFGLVNFIVDVETAFLDEDVEISLTSEAAMSSRISPFRSVGSLCNFISKQLNCNE